MLLISSSWLPHGLGCFSRYDNSYLSYFLLRSLPPLFNTSICFVQTSISSTDFEFVISFMTKTTSEFCSTSKNISQWNTQNPCVSPSCSLRLCLSLCNREDWCHNPKNKSTQTPNSLHSHEQWHNSIILDCNKVTLHKGQRLATLWTVFSCSFHRGRWELINHTSDRKKSEQDCSFRDSTCTHKQFTLTMTHMLGAKPDTAR